MKAQSRCGAESFDVRSHYFCGLMGEAIYSLVRAHQLQQEALQLQSEGVNTHIPASMLSDAGIFARYAFLLACNGFDNSAHSIFANSPKFLLSLTEDIDRLSTLNRFEVFALAHGKSVDRGDARYQRAKQVIKCRNEFVHPKQRLVQIHRERDKAETRSIGGQDYPVAFDFIEIEQVCSMVGDVMRFIAWVVFDICQYSPTKGAKLINGSTKWWIMAFHEAKELWNYDLRSLGDFADIKVTPVVIDGSPKRTRRRRKAKK